MARFVIEGTQVIDHEKFLDAGVHGRDLWEWGMKYSGKHETDGALPMSAVLASPWGYGGKANIKAANRLVEVGLWVRTEKGFQILRWTEQGNKTKAELDESREFDRAKKATKRAEARAKRAAKETVPHPVPGGHPEGLRKESLPVPVPVPVPVSSSSGRDPEPDRSPTPNVWGRGATAEKALEVFADAVTAVTGEPFVVGPAPFLRDDLCALMNKLAPKSGTLGEAMTWLGDTTRAWVRATPDLDDRKPSKLTAWLNGGRKDRAPRSGGGPRGDRQPHDQGWLDRMLATGTDGKEF